ncbi:MAG: hypothetical protein IPI83_08725 [Sphingomonadales bacterium]|nr:hypothetical protein [Sphingomonadales bacterium]
MKPTLRFPEFTGAWQAKHGDDAFKSRRQRATEGLPLYSVTMDQGMVRRDSLDREFASNAPDEANLRVFKDDHVYNMMRMWQGAVGRAPEDCMVSPAYVVLQPKPGTDPHFLTIGSGAADPSICCGPIPTASPVTGSGYTHAILAVFRWPYRNRTSSGKSLIFLGRWMSGSSFWSGGKMRWRSIKPA